jgi:hypothetical protein
MLYFKCQWYESPVETVTNEIMNVRDLVVETSGDCELPTSTAYLLALD